MVSLLKDACLAGEWCNFHGMCRSDGSCVCDPEFYGMNCTSEIISGGGVTDVGLAFVIIFGLVFLPCVAFGLFYWYSQHNEDIYDRIRFKTAAELRAENNRRAVARRGSSQVSPSPNRTGTGTASTATTTPSADADTDVEMQRIPSESGEDEGKNGDDPKSGESGKPQLTRQLSSNKQVALQQVKEIMGESCPPDDELIKMMDKNNWNVGNMLAAMLGQQ